MPRVCIHLQTNARGMLTLPAMRPCTQPRAPVLPINSRFARPGIRQLGVVTFRSVPPRPTTTTTTSTTATAFHRPSAFSTTSSHSPTSGDAASSIWRSQRTGRRGFPLRVSIHLVVRYWSTSDHEERPFSKRPRCTSARAYWSSPGHGTGFASVAGAARTRRWHRDAENEKRETENERKRKREGERKRENGEPPGRALRRECSRAGNQCRFRGSGGHHAADYTDYNRLHLYSTVNSRFFSRGDHRAPTLCSHHRATQAGVRA